MDEIIKKVNMHSDSIETYDANKNKMRKEDAGKTRVCIQYDDHVKVMCSVMCSLMEHQSLVDLAIRCGSNTMHAHKCVMAASSPYFREQLEKNPGTEQVVINGLDFAIMKSIIEFIYCGETNILEENLKHVAAAAKLFQIRGLQALAPETHYDPDESIQVPPPVFLTKKPKYSSAYVSYVPNNNPNPAEKMDSPSDPNYRRMKRKYVRTTIEADKACAREARASRLALEALKKELGPTNQLHNFEIEESCTETTVENFIPSTEDENFINDLDGVPLQVVNYSELSNLSQPTSFLSLSKSLPNNLIPFEVGVTGVKTVEKIRDVFCQEMQTNVEIMYKTPEGEFVKVTDEVLRNITGDTLQFQVIDENGREGEIQLLDDKIKMKADDIEQIKKKKFEETFREFISTTYSETPSSTELDNILMNFQDLEPKSDGRADKTKSPADTEDHTDILKEINSMQYYDRSVYEDVADQVEASFKKAENAKRLEQKESAEGVEGSEVDQTETMDVIELDMSPKYSPRKTRSGRSALSLDDKPNIRKKVISL